MASNFRNSHFKCEREVENFNLIYFESLNVCLKTFQGPPMIHSSDGISEELVLININTANTYITFNLHILASLVLYFAFVVVRLLVRVIHTQVSPQSCFNFLYCLKLLVKVHDGSNPGVQSSDKES